MRGRNILLHQRLQRLQQPWTPPPPCMHSHRRLRGGSTLTYLLPWQLQARFPPHRDHPLPSPLKSPVFDGLISRPWYSHTRTYKHTEMHAGAHPVCAPDRCIHVTSIHAVTAVFWNRFCFQRASKLPCKGSEHLHHLVRVRPTALLHSSPLTPKHNRLSSSAELQHICLLPMYLHSPRMRFRLSVSFVMVLTSNANSLIQHALIALRVDIDRSNRKFRVTHSCEFTLDTEMFERKVALTCVHGQREGKRPGGRRMQAVAETQCKRRLVARSNGAHYCDGLSSHSNCLQQAQAGKRKQADKRAGKQAARAL